MPVYEYECSKGHYFTRYLKLENYKDPQTCNCGCESRKLISTPMIAPMFEDYQSPIDGSAITSKKKRREDLAKNECVEYDPGMLDDYNKRGKESEARLEKEIDRTVDKEFESMNPRQRENLAKELSAGADLTYYRGE